MTEPLYAYDIPSLQPGDILLSTTSEKPSGWIRAATGSAYSHAMLYTYNTIVHADGDGVFSTNPQRRLFLESQSIVLRLRSPHNVDLNAVCAFAFDRAGSLYTVPEAMLAAFIGASGTNALSPNQFCSRLVAQAFEAGGVSLVRNADFCVPGQFTGSDLLQHVPKAVRLATPAEIKLNETRDTIKIHQQHTFAWLGKVRALASSRCVEVASISDALDFVLRHPDTDPQVAGFIKQSGYLDDCELDCEANPHRYSVQGMEAVLTLHPSEVRHILSNELQIKDDVARNALVQMQQMSASPLSTFRLLTDMHRRRLEQILERVTIVRMAAERHSVRDIISRAEVQQQALAGCILLGRKHAQP